MSDPRDVTVQSTQPIILVDVIIDHPTPVVDVVVEQGLPGAQGPVGPQGPQGQPGNLPIPIPADVGKAVIVRNPGPNFVADFLLPTDIHTLTTPFAGPLLAPGFFADGLAGTLRPFGARTAGKDRWQWGANASAEGGANAGSDYVLNRYADDGLTLLGAALTLERATGEATFSAGVTSKLTFRVDAAAGVERMYVVRTSGVARWRWGGGAQCRNRGERRVELHNLSPIGCRGRPWHGADHHPRQRLRDLRQRHHRSRQLRHGRLYGGPVPRHGGCVRRSEPLAMGRRQRCGWRRERRVELLPVPLCRRRRD